MRGKTAAVFVRRRHQGAVHINCLGDRGGDLSLVVVVGYAAGVGTDKEVFLLEEAPKQLVIGQEAPLLRFLPIVRFQERYKVGAPRRGTTAREVASQVLVVVLAVASDELSALVGRKLSLEDEDATATHARELRVLVQVLADACTELSEF